MLQLKARKLFRRIILMLFIMIICPAQISKAASYQFWQGQYTVKNKAKVVVTKGYRYGEDYKPSVYRGFTIKEALALDLDDKLKNVKVTVSNKSVATVKNSRSVCFEIKCKKAGTTKVIMTAKKKVVKKGKVTYKKVKYWFTLKVKNNTYPLKSLKINGKEYASKLRTDGSFLGIATRRSTLPVTFKLASGWSASMQSEGNGRGTIKSGLKLHIDDYGEYILLTLKNKKSGMRIHYVIRIDG